MINTFLYNYKSSSIEDSLALLPVKYDNIASGFSHEELARYYAQQGEFEKAFYEYLALIHISPFVEKFYLEATNYAIILKKTCLMKNILLTMPNLESNYFGLVLLGKIYQSEENLDKAIFYFNQALQVTKAADYAIQAWEGLFQIYYNRKMKMEMNYALTQIKTIDPSYRPSPFPKKNILVPVDSKVAPFISKAIKLVKEQKFEDALEILLRSLKVEETAFAYQMIGNILYKQRKIDKAYYFLKKAYRLVPYDKDLVNNLVVLCIMQKDFINAKEYLEKYKFLEGENEAYHHLVRMYNKALSESKNLSGFHR